MRDDNTYTGDGEDLDLVTLKNTGRQLQKTVKEIDSSSTVITREDTEPQR